MHDVAKEKFQRLKKVPWDPVIKGLAAAGFILFSRRLIYYVHFDGVIQTKFSIWWVDTCVLTGLFFIFFLFLALPLLIIFVFLLFSFALFTGDGRVMILHKLETAQSRKAFENLVESAHSIKDNHYKSSVLRVTAMAIAQHGDTSWATAIAKGIPDMRIRTIALKLIQQGKEEK